MYKVCIFDLDGTLTNTLESLTWSVNETLKTLGRETISHEQCRSFIGDGTRLLMERALEATGGPEVSGSQTYQREGSVELHPGIEEAMQVFNRVFEDGCIYQVEPYDGVREMLRTLRSRGCKLAVFTNKPHLQAVRVVDTVFGAGQFDLIQGQQEGLPKKPDPTGVYQILEKLGVKKRESVYVGDSDVDMKTGKASGLFTVGVTWGFRPKELLEQSGADITIDSAMKLPEIFSSEISVS